MKERFHLEQSIDAIEKDRASYDKNIKELLADVQILARIIKYTVSEAEDLTIEQIIEAQRSSFSAKLHYHLENRRYV